MFEASAPFLLFDIHRVPYAWRPAPGPWARLTPERGGPAVWWPRPDTASQWPAGTRSGRFLVGDIPIFGHVVADAPAGGEAIVDVRDGQGQVVAAIRRAPDGSITLPFDPAEITVAYWSERYRRIGGSAVRHAVMRRAKHVYYRVRPVLPRRAQLALRRRFTGMQARSTFPRWPIEPALHDLHDRLFELLAEVAGEPIPRIAPWPNGHRWALVLTHDVEHAVGLENLHLLRDVELRHDVRSSWNLVAGRYAVDPAVVEALVRDGFEIGVHGLMHDGRDLAPGVLPGRLPAMRRAAADWGAVGFRSPATNREWDVMPALGFEYDSSSPDTDPYEPDAGGCCSWLPFFNGDTVELPITLPQDHTLWEILERDEPREWHEKARYLAERGGMALLITHPDYMLAPERLDAYDRFLAGFAHAPDGWVALPREVDDWWRRRAVSCLEATETGWRVTGPAEAEAVVELVGAPARVSAGR